MNLLPLDTLKAHLIGEIAKDLRNNYNYKWNSFEFKLQRVL